MHAISQYVVIAVSSLYSRVYESTEVNVQNLVIVWDYFRNLNTETMFSVK